MTVSARTLLDQPELWQELSHGLAVFVSRDSLRAWPLPFVCEELCVVGKHAYLLPLLGVGNERRALLRAGGQPERGPAARRHAGPDRGSRRARSTGQSRRRHCTTTPRQGNLADALGHTASSPGKEGVVFHGQGGEVDVAKQELTSFFREIDRAVGDFLQLHSEPLIFAGVDYLFPIYQVGQQLSASCGRRRSEAILTCCPLRRWRARRGRWWKPVYAHRRQAEAEQVLELDRPRSHVEPYRRKSWLPDMQAQSKRCSSRPAHGGSR